MMVVLMKLSALVDWFTLSVLIAFLVIKQKQFKVCTAIVLMTKPKQSFMELYDKVDADFQLPVDGQLGLPDIMVNAWSLLYE